MNNARKILICFIFSVIICVGLFLPFKHLGGNYYRGLLLIWHKSRISFDGGFIPWSSSRTNFEIVWWADPFTFKHLDGSYAVDRNYIYFEKQPVIKADLKTFRVLGNGYYGDKNDVRWHGWLIRKKQALDQPSESFDADTFQPFNEKRVKDKTGIYQKTGLTEKEDETWSAIIFLLEKDPPFLNSHYYYGLDCGYINSDQGIMWHEKYVEEADAESFEVFAKGQGHECKDGHYARDKNRIYHKDKEVKDADPASFRLLGKGLAIDKNNRYKEGVKID